MAEDNSASPTLNRDEAEVALPLEAREDNFDVNSTQEAEPNEARDLAPTPMSIGIEGGATTHPQRIRCPPAWLGDFITSGDLEQSLTNSRAYSTAITMAQKQLENPPLDIHDMWHLSDDEERKERHLPRRGIGH